MASSKLKTPQNFGTPGGRFIPMTAPDGTVITTPDGTPILVRVETEAPYAD